MKKVFVTGSAGLVGSRFVELTKDKYNLLTPEINELDLTDKSRVTNFIKSENPDVIIHLAAYTDVGEAENQRDDKNSLCWKVNVEATRNLVDIVDPTKTHLIYISTDMVFSGSEENPGPYAEDHKLETDSSKLTWYGCTKAEGERLISKKLIDNSTILRLIYPVRANFEGKLDYIHRPLKLYDEGKLYPMFTDQQVSIAYIDEIVEVLGKIIEKKVYGAFHASSSDTTTPYDLYTYLIGVARGDRNAVTKSSIHDFPKKVASPVRYPVFGGLRVEHTQKALGMKFSTSKEIVDKILLREG